MMQWENLVQFQCAYCGSELRDDGAIIRCTSCKFAIEKERFEKIRMHRSQPRVETIRMHWQLLHENKCPMCESVLEEKGDTLDCPKTGCTFKIAKSVMEDILTNPEHPANRFHKANRP